MRPVSLTLRSETCCAAGCFKNRPARPGSAVAKAPVPWPPPTPSRWPVQLQSHSHYSSLQYPAQTSSATLLALFKWKLPPATPPCPQLNEPPYFGSHASLRPSGVHGRCNVHWQQPAFSTCAPHMTHMWAAAPHISVAPSCGYRPLPCCCAAAALPQPQPACQHITPKCSTRPPGARLATVALHMPRCRGGGARATVLLRENYGSISNWLAGFSLA
jgi:hypothetical protein